jgi:hypothetical protein
MSFTFHGESIIFLLMGAFFVAGGLYGRRSQLARKQRGVRATATLVALIPSRQLFTPKVRFTTADNRVVEAKTESAADAGQYEVGQEIEVIYDPQDPDNVDLASATAGGTSAMILIGLIFAGVAVLQILGYLPIFERYD